MGHIQSVVSTGDPHLGQLVSTEADLESPGSAHIREIFLGVPELSPVPQVAQNAASEGFFVPHERHFHGSSREAPHLMQNLASCATIAPQALQFPRAIPPRPVWLTPDLVSACEEQAAIPRATCRPMMKHGATRRSLDESCAWKG